MKILIVFEDKFGVASVYNAFHIELCKIEVENVYSYIDSDNNNVYIYTEACNVTAIKLSSNIVDIVRLFNIDTIISVFDIDTLNGSLSGVTDSQEFIKISNKSKYIKSLGSDIKHLYMPVVYNVETVLLHQFIHPLTGNIDLLDLVNTYSIRKLHLNILTSQLKREGYICSAKAVDNYIDLKRLLFGYKVSHRNEDRHFRLWLLNGCSNSLDYFIERDDVIQLLDSVKEFVEQKLAEGVKIYKVDDYVIDCRVEGTSKPAFYKIEN